jgi:non-ribosomal peptide synthetase component F
MAAFQTLLYAYTGQKDVIVGTDVAQRDHAEIEGLIGFFVNQLVFRTNLSNNPSFGEVLQRIHSEALDAYTYQALPFDRLVDALNIERTLEQTPLFQVKFVLQNPPLSEMRLAEGTLELVEVLRGTTKFDILLNMWEQDEVLHGMLDYSIDLFARATIERMVWCFEKLLRTVVEQPDMRLEEVRALLMEADRDQRIHRQRERKAANMQQLGQKSRRAMDHSTNQ